MTDNHPIVGLIDERVNEALERAARAVYASEYVWDDKDQVLSDAAARVRALKTPARTPGEQ